MEGKGGRTLSSIQVQKKLFLIKKWEYKSVHTAQGTGAAENGRKLLICLSKQKSNIVVLLAACVLTFEPLVK